MLAISDQISSTVPDDVGMSHFTMENSTKRGVKRVKRRRLVQRM